MGAPPKNADIPTLDFEMVGKLNVTRSEKIVFGGLEDT